MLSGWQWQKDMKELSNRIKPFTTKSLSGYYIHYQIKIFPFFKTPFHPVEKPAFSFLQHIENDVVAIWHIVGIH